MGCTHLSDCSRRYHGGSTGETPGPPIIPPNPPLGKGRIRGWRAGTPALRVFLYSLIPNPLLLAPGQRWSVGTGMEIFYEGDPPGRPYGGGGRCCGLKATGWKAWTTKQIPPFPSLLKGGIFHPRPSTRFSRGRKLKEDGGRCPAYIISGH